MARNARRIRDLHWGHTITYSRKVFIPLTNMCRNTCGYCAFVQKPESPLANLMRPEQVLASLKQAERLGCKEALFSLGERPEARYPEAARRLAALGYTDLVDYLYAMCALTLSETTLIPHVNAGALREADLLRLRPVAASMGMMIESLSLRLFRRGGPHFRCPDKVPKRRLHTLHAAGRLHIPMTTGILIGIGETARERIETLEAINDLNRTYGHIQEVIVQNFRAKPGTEMASAPEPTLECLLETIATARQILDPSISLQAPPNLTGDFLALVDAGINDLGGISPLTIDFINPERPWPNVAKLSERLAARGFVLRERLTVYPRFILGNDNLGNTAAGMQVLQMHGQDGLARADMLPEQE